MRVILHIGQSKTGTSSIQACLMHNAGTLRRQGVLYPLARRGGVRVGHGSHNALADALVGKSRYPYLSADEYFTQFFREARKTGAQTLILSAEHFFGGEPRVWDVPDETTYFARYRQKIEALRSYLDGCEVELVCYLRPQVDWLASTVTQTVRTERLASPSTIYEDDWQFFRMARPLLRYSRLVESWLEGLGPSRAQIVPYEVRALKDGSPVLDFLDRAGLADVELAYEPREMHANRSPSPAFTEVKKELNRVARSKNDERTVIEALERQSARIGSGGTYALEWDVVQWIAELAEVENAWLNADVRGEDAKCFRALAMDSPQSGARRPTSEEVDWARDAFNREYQRLRRRLRPLSYGVRELVRERCPFTHGVLHRLKSAARKWRSEIPGSH